MTLFLKALVAFKLSRIAVAVTLDDEDLQRELKKVFISFDEVGQTQST